MATPPSFAIVIPARYQSTRFPAKPLAALRGATGVAKTLIQRSWECASAVTGAASVWVATDDDRIAKEVEGFGGQVVMTSPDCANGTERCAEAVDRLGAIADFIVNLQGDAPLSPTFAVPALVERLVADADAQMATPAIRASRSMIKHLLVDEAQGRVGGTTVVFDAAQRALYFSKRILPYFKELPVSGELPPVHLHLGIYAYRTEAMQAYRTAQPSRLELLEGLEQLRFLDFGANVAVVPLAPLDWDPIELNNPSDVPAIERILQQRGIA